MRGGKAGGSHHNKYREIKLVKLVIKVWTLMMVSVVVLYGAYWYILKNSFT